MAKEYFCAYHSYLKSIRNLSDAECGRLFKALLQYSAGEQLINLQGREGIAFDFICEQIDRDNEKYAERCRTNRENGTKANAPEWYRTPPKEKEKEKEKEILPPEVIPPLPPKGAVWRYRQDCRKAGMAFVRCARRSKSRLLIGRRR